MAGLMFNNAPASQIEIAKQELTATNNEVSGASDSTNMLNEELIKNQKKLTEARLSEMQTNRKKKRACVYHEAAMAASSTQGKALCIAKKKSFDAEYQAVDYLRQFETAGALTPLPPRLNFDPETQWDECVGGLGCAKVSKPTIISRKKNKKFTYPFVIRFTLPLDVSHHRVDVSVVDGPTYTTKGKKTADGSYEVVIEREPDFPAFGSADVYIYSMNACGMKSKADS